MDKRSLSERDICTKFITPALRRAGWDEMRQIREEVSFTKGRIIVRGKLVTRGQAKRADYILYYKPNIPVAVIEAKDNSHSVGDGMQQALGYAETLNIPFVFSSNGDGFVFHDRTGASAPREVDLALDAFPAPGELWARYRAWKGLTPEAEEIVLQDYHEDGGGKAPRYYQINAVNAAIEAIAKGQDRILLVMATGTGKTYTAFQIIWRLWKGGYRKRVLFLADRNVLVDQTMVNDFRPFGGTMAKLSASAKTIQRSGGVHRVDAAYEIYLGLYQAITGPEEYQKTYRWFSPGFFDLIVIDECHRGSAADDSAWREILEYFSSATQIGLTATPKETRYASNIAYFGEPVFSYSLKEGIRDGFLAPHKVVKVHIDRDVEGYRPEKGQLDRDGEEVEGRIYNVKDFDRTLVIDGRTKLVAQKVTAFLRESGDRFQKAIVFCIDQVHAARMRQALINENADLVGDNSRYVMRITGDDAEGQNELGRFTDPESKYPVLVTTSRLLSTGVDVQTCRLIVLDREVVSMTEFKQIVGRGTRVHEDTRKYYFTLMDFRDATGHFRTRETADLFLALIVRLLKPGGRAAVVLPDGSLFGEGVKTRLKEHLMEECNLHTVVRLPNSVFRPYASIGTNLLFFEKGEPTKDVWFWEHLVPEGQKAYSMTRPIRLEHLDDCADWWGGAERAGREEGGRAWKVSAEDIRERGYNLDIKNPQTSAEDHGDPEVLLEELTSAEAEVASVRDRLKGVLAEALLR